MTATTPRQTSHRRGGARYDIGTFLTTTIFLLVIAMAGGCARRSYSPLIYHFGSPWTQAEVNGQAGMFLLDTGASMTVVDTLIAQRARAETVGTQDVIATTGDVQLQTIMARRIDVGGRVHRDRVISVQDFGGFQAPGGRRQGGLIGSDFFLDYTLVLEVPRARYQLTTRPAPTQTDLLPHRMRLNGGIPQVQVFFGPAQFPIWSKLDTGSGYATEGSVYLDVSPDVAQRFLGSRLNEEPDDKVRIISLAGRSELPIYDYGPVRLFGRDFESVRLVVHVHGEGAFSRPDVVLVTGSILRQFQRVEVDYPNRMVWTR